MPASVALLLLPAFQFETAKRPRSALQPELGIEILTASTPILALRFNATAESLSYSFLENSTRLEAVLLASDGKVVVPHVCDLARPRHRNQRLQRPRGRLCDSLLLHQGRTTAPARVPAGGRSSPRRRGHGLRRERL